MKKILYKITSVLFFILFLSGIIFSQSKVAIYYSNLSENSDEFRTSNLINHITFIELLLMQNKIQYDVIYQADLLDGIEDEYDILVLPSVDVITEEEYSALSFFLKNGNSIFSIKSRLELPFILYNKSYQSESGLADLNYIETEASYSSVFQHINPEDIFTVDQKYDNRLLLSLKNKLLYSSSRSSILNPAGELQFDNGTENISSVFLGKYLSGKIAWLGFYNEDIIGGDEDIAEYKNLLLSFINYLDNKADVEIKIWPEKFLSTQIITLRYNNFLKAELIDKLQMDGFAPQLIIPSNSILSDDIKSKFNDEDFILDLTNLNLSNGSTVQINDTLKYFKENFKLSFEQVLINRNNFTAIQIEILKQYGVKTILLSQYDSLLPNIISNEIVTIPFETSVSQKYSVNFINYTPVVKCESNPDGEFLSLINNLDKTKSWITNLSSLHNWLVKRSKISVELSEKNKDSYRIFAKNNNFTEVNDIAILVNMPAKLNLLNVVEGNIRSDYILDDRTGILQINVPVLKPLESKTFLISTD